MCIIICCFGLVIKETYFWPLQAYHGPVHTGLSGSKHRNFCKTAELVTEHSHLPFIAQRVNIFIYKIAIMFFNFLQLLILVVDKMYEWYKTIRLLVNGRNSQQ